MNNEQAIAHVVAAIQQDPQHRQQSADPAEVVDYVRRTFAAQEQREAWAESVDFTTRYALDVVLDMSLAQLVAALPKVAAQPTPPPARSNRQIPLLTLLIALPGAVTHGYGRMTKDGSPCHVVAFREVMTRSGSCNPTRGFSANADAYTNVVDECVRTVRDTLAAGRHTTFDAPFLVQAPWRAQLRQIAADCEARVRVVVFTEGERALRYSGYGAASAWTADELPDRLLADLSATILAVDSEGYDQVDFVAH